MNAKRCGIELPLSLTAERKRPAAGDSGSYNGARVD